MNKPAIGQPLPRVDAWDKVRGQALYPGDMVIEGMVWARAVRAGRPHARIVAIDTRPAQELDGVLAVLTAKDIDGPNKYGLMRPDQEVLCTTKVRYTGDVVALVVAETREIAEMAAGRVIVEYEDLPAVFDPVEAMQPGAPLIHESGNIVETVRLRRGDVDAAFAASDIIIEGEYSTPFVEHAYLQPEAGVAHIDENGKITIWAGTQWLHDNQRQIAEALGLPRERIRLVQMATGGAFGGREDLSVQILLALATLKTGRPVKMVYSREESVTCSTKRHPFRMRYRHGATRDGRLLAMELYMVTDAGAYASTSGAVLQTSVSVCAGAYEVPNVRVDAYTVYTNNPITAAMRGFGSNQPNFAVEAQMNKLAHALNMDPVELRLKNILRQGSTALTGQYMDAPTGGPEVLQAAVQKARELGFFDQPAGASHSPLRRGVGIACGMKNVGYNFGFADKSTVKIELWPDRARVLVACCEVGQGSTTMLAHIAAAELGLPIERIEVVTPDTNITPDGGSSSASRQTFVSGNALKMAAREAKENLEDLGPEPPADVLPVVAQATYTAPATTPLDPETGQCRRPNFSYGFGANVIELNVDSETGQIYISRAVAVHNVGKAINPLSIEGQIHGGFVMAQGYALTEEYKLIRGIPQTTNLATFIIPTALDVPHEIVPIIVEVPDPNGPYGARGVGEMTMLPAPGAIHAALFDALGIWVDRLPFTGEAILRAMGRVK